MLLEYVMLFGSMQDRAVRCCFAKSPDMIRRDTRNDIWRQRYVDDRDRCLLDGHNVKRKQQGFDEALGTKGNAVMSDVRCSRRGVSGLKLN